MTLDAEAQRRVEDAFVTAQGRTAAPIEGVLAPASGQYEAPGLILTLIVALFTPWPLFTFTAWPSGRIYLAQLSVALVLAGMSMWPRFGVVLTRGSALRVNVHRAAMGQFVARGLDRAPGRNGVLIYVSLAERIARVEADEAALAAVPLTQWQGLINAMTPAIGRGDLEAALSGAAARAADLLGAAFPAGPE